MKVTRNWLSDFIDISGITTEDMAEKLTMSGLEVEDIIELAKVENVVVGKVLSKEKHPDADKLSLCTVTDGTEEFQVVCGAPNVDAGQTIAFAKVGAKLPGGFKIKKSKIRGVVSMGMICSEDELGLVDERAGGIMVLPSDLELGTDINEVVGLGDTVIDIYITPNRADCTSVYGVAREIAALYDLEMKAKDYSFEETDDAASNYGGVKVENTEKCPFYLGRVIKGVEIKPSPLWMQNRLRAVGVRPISNVVDITNYVNFEYGQPLHTFDLRQIDGSIIVRDAKEGEKLLTLDEKERELKDYMLLIADEKKPLAVAGVMGGEHSGIADDTTDVFLECAYFQPESVRVTARRLGMQTDASYRYERGIDHAQTPEMVNYAAYLIQLLAGGGICKGVLSNEYDLIDTPEVTFNPEKINGFLGTDIPVDEMTSILTRLGMKPEKDGENYKLKSPSFRVDIERWQDIAEEVARVYGYDKVPTTAPYIPSDSFQQSRELQLRNKWRMALVALGFNEVVNYSFLSDDFMAKFDDPSKFVKVLNPISEDMNTMRTYVFPGMLQSIMYNLNQGFKNIRVYEKASTYIKQEGELPLQKNSLAIGMAGDFWPLSWSAPSNPEPFFAMKGVVNNILAEVGFECAYERSGREFLHPGKSAELMKDGKSYGFIGEIHPALLEDLGIKEAVCIAEIFTQELLEDNKTELKFEQFSKFPSVYKDISILVDNDKSAGDMEKCIVSVSELIDEVTLYDVYTGKGVDEDKRSLAFRIFFSNPEKTLTDEETNKVLTDIINKLGEDFGAKLR